MSRSEPLPRTGASPPGHPRLAAVVVAALCWAVLGSCAPAADPGSPAPEDTGAPAPAQELTGAVEGAEAPEGAVSVDLPALPIGGDDVEFSTSVPARCVNVNWTAGTLLEGVSVRIRAFGASDQFVVVSEPCSPTPCLRSVLTASSPSCTVAVAWTGARAEPEASQLTVTGATLTCVDESRCRTTLALIQQEGPATIGLLVAEEEPLLPGDTSVSPGDDDVSPADEDVSPADEDVSPADEAVSPSAESS